VSRIWPISFNKRFVDLVELGVKTQTIRANRKDGRRPVPGDQINCYFGLRTKHATLIKIGEITSVRDVRIEPARKLVWIGGSLLPPKKWDGFAKADGFEDYADMMSWWQRTHAAERFNGFMIQWCKP
jgi:hypothetical protein